MATPLESLVENVRAMLLSWPHIDVVIEGPDGVEETLSAEAWLKRAAGQWLHEALGGEAAHLGTFKRAMRRVGEGT